MVDEIRLVVFDMAGTTVEDDGQVPDAFEKALAEHNLSVTAEQLNRVRGSSKRQAIVDLIPESLKNEVDADAVYNTFCKNLTLRYQSEGVKSVAGAEESFHRLRSNGISVALNTGFDRDITNLILKSLNWTDGVVDAIVCGDDVELGRPSPDLILRAMDQTGVTSSNQVANVGDTVLDLEAGHNAGVRFNIGVLSGAHDRHRLEMAPHTHVVASITDAVSIVTFSSVNKR
jgi:phosphonatase-like hydrolase